MIQRDGRIILNGGFLNGLQPDYTQNTEAAFTLAALLEASPEAIICHTLEGIILRWNRGAEQLYGYSAEEAIGQSLSLLIPDDHLQEFLEVLNQLKRGEGIRHYETLHLTKGKRLLSVSLSLAPIKDQSAGAVGAVILARQQGELEQLKQALQESREQFHDLFENAGDIIYSLDLEGRLIAINSAGERLGGYSREEILSLNVGELLSQDSLEQGLHMLDRKVSGQAQTVYEVELICKDGSRKTLDIRSRLLYRNGKIAGVQGIGRDITERKRAEAALQASEQRFTMVFNASPVLSGITTLDTGEFVEVNSTVLEASGYSRGEIIGGTSTGLALWPTLRSRETFINRLKEQGRVRNLETTLQTKLGEERAVLISADLIEFDGKPCILFVGTDVTERKLALAALRESEDRYRDLVEHSQELICTHDLQGRILSVNPSAARVLGYKDEEFKGKNLRDLLPRKHREEFQKYLDKIQQDGAASGLMAVQTRTGEKRIWEYHNSIRTDGVEMPVVRGMARDITERVRLEEQLRQAQKMEAVGRLAGGIAHDFNNLLTVINGYSELTSKKLSELDPLRLYVEEIKKAGMRATSLTNQLLTFSRRQVLQPRILDLNQVISESKNLLNRLIGEDVELVTTLGENLERVKADPGQIEQVILNLSINARDAMPKGGKLIIETANVDLDDDYASFHVDIPTGRYVMLAVSDTGCGMNAITLSHLFEPFFTTKERGKGTGLGLATVYGIVKQSGGHILVYSEPGQGTTFKVYLPSVDERIETYSEIEITCEHHRGTETILLVEDEDALRQLTSQLLKQNGYTVLDARHGGEALLLCERHKDSINLMLTDVVMPHMNGRELAERLMLVKPDMKVIFMSGYTDDAIVHYGILESGITFLQKPFTQNILLRKVRETLDAN